MVSNTSLYADSIAVVERARMRHINILGIEKFPVHIIYIKVHQNVVHNWHEKGFGSLNVPNFTRLSIMLSISEGNPE